MGTTYRPPCTARELRLVANDLRRDVVDEIGKAASGHPGGSLSAADIMSVLFFSGAMDFNPEDPRDHSRDRFFLSKGHAAPVLYAVFHRLGWLTDADMGTLRKLGSRLQGHPDSKVCPGVEVCSGSLGQGLSVAAGVALGLKMDAREEGRASKRVYVLCGDGEMQEGSNWEALMFSSQHALDNMTMLLDRNGLQIDGRVEDVCSLGDVSAKLSSFGWDTQEVCGHDVVALERALAKAKATTGRPQAIVCATVKGKGVSFMENEAGWHGHAPDHAQAEAARAELAAGRLRILGEKEAK